LPSIETAKADIEQIEGAELFRPCPIGSNVDLFRNGKCIAHLDARVPMRAFDLAVTKKKLDGPQVFEFLGSPQGVRAVQMRIEDYANKPIRHEPSIPARRHALAWPPTWEKKNCWWGTLAAQTDHD
jgi:hypothetical protein